MPAAPRHYLILTRHLLVAEDLAQIIAQFEPAAVVARARSPDEAHHALPAGAPLALAFLADAHGQPGWDELVGRLEARRTRIVLIPRDDDTPPPATGRRYRTLERPFTTEMVLELLAAMLGDSASGG